MMALESDMPRRRRERINQPSYLQAGDVVEVHIERRYLQFTVLYAQEHADGERQTVTASAPGLGSCSFEWPWGRDTKGRRYYFVRRP